LQLSEAVINSDKDKGKVHQVFERLFDCKEITSKHFFLQKLNYMHNKPSSEIWNLVNNPAEYVHSPVKYYLSGEQGEYLIKDE